jgi:hypothetical protein
MIGIDEFMPISSNARVIQSFTIKYHGQNITQLTRLLPPKIESKAVCGEYMEIP